MARSETKIERLIVVVQHDDQANPEADSKKDIMETAGEEYGLLKDILKELNVDTRGMSPLSMAQIQWR